MFFFLSRSFFVVVVVVFFFFFFFLYLLNVEAGYTTFKGTVLQGSELTTLVEGLEANDLLDGYTHMLTVRGVFLGPTLVTRRAMGGPRTHTRLPKNTNCILRERGVNAYQTKAQVQNSTFLDMKVLKIKPLVGFLKVCPSRKNIGNTTCRFFLFFPNIFGIRCYSKGCRKTTLEVLSFCLSYFF